MQQPDETPTDGADAAWCRWTSSDLRRAVVPRPQQTCVNDAATLPRDEFVR